MRWIETSHQLCLMICAMYIFTKPGIHLYCYNFLYIVYIFLCFVKIVVRTDINEKYFININY